MNYLGRSRSYGGGISIPFRKFKKTFVLTEHSFIMIIKLKTIILVE
jgi:hypothetical protein